MDSALSPSKVLGIPQPGATSRSSGSLSRICVQATKVPPVRKTRLASATLSSGRARKYRTFSAVTASTEASASGRQAAVALIAGLCARRTISASSSTQMVTTPRGARRSRRGPNASRLRRLVARRTGADAARPRPPRSSRQGHRSYRLSSATAGRDRRRTRTASPRPSSVSLQREPPTHLIARNTTLHFLPFTRPLYQ